MPTLEPLAEAELCVPATMIALAARARPPCASLLSFMKRSSRSGRRTAHSTEELLPAGLIDLDLAGRKSINPRRRRHADQLRSRPRGDRSPTDHLWPKGSVKPPCRCGPQGMR